MIRWLVALAASSIVGFVAVPRMQRRAFKAGWFERSSQTRRSRSQRRPTHGGLVLAVAVVAGSLLAGPGEPIVQAAVVAAALAVASGWRAERGQGPPWLVAVGQVLAAVTLPVFGISAELTGTAGADAALTAVGVLVLVRGLRSVERADGASLVLVGPAAAAFLVVTERADDLAPVAAALVGASLGLLAHAWPPATVRIGAVGPTVLAVPLAAVAIELSPDVTAPRSLLVPVLALLPIAAAAVIRGWDRRLRRRGLPAAPSLALVAICAAVAAERLAADALDLLPALALGALPTAVLAIVGLLTPRPLAQGEERHPGRSAAVALAAVVVLGGLAAVAGFLVLDARRSMLTGREAATAGLDIARAGDLEGAQAQFEKADVAFADAARALDNPIVRLGEVVPGIAPNLRNAQTLADVGGDLSSTAVAVAERAGADDLL
ncbi:MAG: hypothetical protein ACSLFP_14510, partial [Acidimicrobiales bacterium]